MKRFAALILTLYLLLGTCSALADISYGTATVNNPMPDQWLNLRAQPSTSSATMGGYYSGVTATVLEYTNANWVKVQIGNRVGYMLRTYLQFGASYVASAIPTYQAVQNISLYNTPTDYYAMGTFASGARVELLGFIGDVWHVRVNNSVMGFLKNPTGSLKQLTGPWYAGGATAVISQPKSTSKLNLRQQPDSNSRSLGLYYNGVVVRVLDENTEGWAHVRIGAQEGYMMKAYLKMDGLSGAAVNACPTMYVSRASGKRLNLRPFPSSSNTTSPSLGLYDGGTVLTVIGYNDNWYHVRIGESNIGYMMKEYVTSTYGGYDTPAPATATPTWAPVTPAPATATKLDNVDSNGSWKGPLGLHATTGWNIADEVDSNKNVLPYAIVVNPNPADRLHLRVWESSDASSLGKYYTGTHAVILDTSNPTWVKVRVGNNVGFMMRKYLAITEAEKAAVNPALPVMTVNNYDGSNLTLREGKGTWSASMGIYSNGTQVVLLGYESTWAHVLVDGKIGYMVGKYLK